MNRTPRCGAVLLGIVLAGGLSPAAPVPARGPSPAASSTVPAGGPSLAAGWLPGSASATPAVPLPPSSVRPSGSAQEPVSDPAPAPPPVSVPDRYALVVSGASGGAEFREKHARWRAELVGALRGLPGFDEDHLTVLAETPGPGVGRASRAGVRRALDALAGRMGDDAVLYVVLIGHGSFDGVDAKFNLVGPDLEAGEWDRWLGDLPGRLVFVNTGSASFPFLRRLSGPGRTVVTATESAAQRYDTVFPQFFIGALADAAADEDRDGRVSVLEAFEFASFGVRQWYRQRGRLATERALIDDNGDGRGREAGQPGPDGPVAARLHVGAGPAAAPPAAADPAVAALMTRRAALEEAVHALKAARPRMAAAAYLDELERALIDLARVSRQIRRLGSIPREPAP